MKTECRNCKRKYDYCPSCILTRPYVRNFCSLVCRNEYEEKQQLKLKQINERIEKGVDSNEENKQDDTISM